MENFRVNNGKIFAHLVVLLVCILCYFVFFCVFLCKVYVVYIMIIVILSIVFQKKKKKKKMSTRGRQPLPQLQGLPLYCTLGHGGWRFQVPVGGHGGSWVNFRSSDFQAHQFEAQNRGRQHQLP